MKPFKIIHVDTEATSLTLFRQISAGIKSIELAGSFLNARDALEYLNQHPVDLVFIDMTMSSANNGLWLAHQLHDKKTGIVFLSAYAEHASLAFEIGALDFISKTLTPEVLENSMNRIQQRLQTLKRLQKEQVSELPANTLDESGFAKRLFVNTHGHIIVINLENVTYLKSVSNYTSIKMKDGQKLIASKHLKVYDEAIHTNRDFLRIHRSSIINKNFVKAIIRKGHRASVIMEDDEVLEISMKRKDLIMEALCK